MKTLSSLSGLAAITVLLVSCAEDGAYRHSEYAVAGVDYDGYYDDFYGPFSDGYWGPDDVFYFTDAPGHAFRRDEAHHFRHDASAGFHAIHGHHAGPVGRAPAPR